MYLELLRFTVLAMFSSTIQCCQLWSPCFTLDPQTLSYWWTCVQLLPISPTPQVQAITFYSASMSLTFLGDFFFISDIMQYLSCYVWLLSLNMIPSRSICVITNGKISFFLMAEGIYAYIYIYLWIYMHSYMYILYLYIQMCIYCIYILYMYKYIHTTYI